MAFLSWFRKKETPYDVNVLKTLTNDVEKLKNTIENQTLELQRLKSNYVQWLEEKEIYIKQIRDRIEKKIDYVNKQQDAAPLKKQIQEAVHKKIMRQLGLKPHGEAQTNQEDVHHQVPRL